MSKKRHTAEQIIPRLREAEVLLAQGVTVGEVCKKLAITQQTYYRWRKEYGSLRVDQAKRLKGLEKENTEAVGYCPVCGEYIEMGESCKKCGHFYKRSQN